METYCIREATCDDAQAIHTLTIDGINHWATDIYDSLKPWVEATCSAPALAKKIASPDYVYYVSVDNNGVINGTSYVNIKDNYFGGLYCGVKGKGMGTALLNKVFETASENSLPYLACEIYEHNIPSISLMTKLGAVWHQSNPFENVVYDEYRFSRETYASKVSVRNLVAA